MIVDEIQGFVMAPDRRQFRQLARRAFEFQYEAIEPYRRFCDAQGKQPGKVLDWEEVPAVPATAFKTLRLAAAPPQEIFRSSGTTAGNDRRSVHHHPFPALYRRVIDVSFPGRCLPKAEPPVLSLIPPRRVLPDSSLSFMADHILARHAGEGSLEVVSERGLDVDAAVDWIGARDHQPVLVLTTALAWLELLDHLACRRKRPRLHAKSVVFETGGFKGRKRQVERKDLVAWTTELLQLSPSRMVREYGMTELTSQAYTAVLAGGDPDVFVPPSWMRVRALDPYSLQPLAAGRTGLLSIFDLANIGSALHIITEDLASIVSLDNDNDPGCQGFRLHGRAGGTELRGCSLSVEELSGTTLRPGLATGE